MTREDDTIDQIDRDFEHQDVSVALDRLSRVLSRQTGRYVTELRGGYVRRWAQILYAVDPTSERRAVSRLLDIATIAPACHPTWSAVSAIDVMVDSFKTPRQLWHTDAEFSRRMLTEWDKIEPYKAKGFIADWPESLI